MFHAEKQESLVREIPLYYQIYVVNDVRSEYLQRAAVINVRLRMRVTDTEDLLLLTISKSEKHKAYHYYNWISGCLECL